MDHLLQQLLGLGCAPVDSGDAHLSDGRARPLRAGGFLLHHQPPHATCGIGQQWLEVREPAHGRAWSWSTDGRAVLPPLRDLRAGDQVVVGHARHPRRCRNRRSATACRSPSCRNGISSERQVETAVRQTAALMRQTIEQKPEGGRRRRTGGGPHRRRRGPLRR